MKTLLLAAVGAACLPFSAPAQTKHDMVIITAHANMRDWVASLSQQLSDNLEYPRSIHAGTAEVGRATITFRRDGDGRASEIALTRSSSSRSLDRAAVRAIERLSIGDPAVAGIAADQRFRADILFAQTQEDVDDQARSLRREAERTRVAATEPDTVIALSAAPGMAVAY